MNPKHVSSLVAAVFFVALGFSLFGCANFTPAQRTDLLARVESLALNAGVIAASSYTATGDVDTTTLIANSVQGGSALMQTLIDYQRANTPPPAQLQAAVTSAIQDGSASAIVSKSVAPKVASIVADAVKDGAPANAAIAAAASGLDRSAGVMKSTARARKKAIEAAP